MRLLTEYAPIAHTATMSGVRMAKGTRRMAAKSGTKARTMATPMTLPVYMLAMRPHTKSGFSLKSMGPGWSPQMMRPPSMTAAVGEPGMPSVIMGKSEAPPAAWAAVFEAALAEAPGILGEGFGEGVAHERGGRGAARLEAHPEPDEAAPHEGAPVARQLPPRFPHHAGIDAGRGALEGEAFLHAQE